MSEDKKYFTVIDLVYYTAFHKSIRHTAGTGEHNDCESILIDLAYEKAILIKKTGHTTIINLKNCIAYSYKEI